MANTRTLSLPLMTGDGGGCIEVHTTVIDAAGAATIHVGKRVRFATQQVIGTELSSANIGSLDWTTTEGDVVVAGANNGDTMYILVVCLGN